MPGYFILSSSAPSSTSRVADVDRATATAHDAAAVPASSSVKALRVVHMPLSQATRLQAHLQLNSAAELAKPKAFEAIRLGVERGFSACSSNRNDHEPSSVCLAAMVDEYIEDDCCGCTPVCHRTHSCTTGLSGEALSNDTSRLMQSLGTCRDDQESKLLKDVQAIVVGTNQANCSEHPCLHDGPTDVRSMVMSALRRLDYDAAVCTTRWDHSLGIPGGDYEFVDVLFPSQINALAGPALRLIVDIGFRAQFEIARPTSEFSALLELVPAIFVGRPERLQQTVHLMAEATKQSLCTKGLHLPPWRKLSYMKAKWFSLYKRTSKSFADRTRQHSLQDRDNRVGEFIGIAKRDNCLDSRCTMELKLLYQGVKHNTGRFSTDGLLNLYKQHSNVIMVTSTDWQFPALETRSPSSASPSSGRHIGRKVTGLASMFLQAGAFTSNTNIIARTA